MKCDKFKQLLEKFEINHLSNDERVDLIEHIKTCNSCLTEYKAIEKYLLVISKLQENKPVLKDKENLTDSIIQQLDDKELIDESYNHKSLQILPYKFRLIITSVAATLVLFFAIQQTRDAWKIKQLESKFALQQKNIDYSYLKAAILISYVGKPDDFKIKGFLSKAIKELIDQTFAKFQYKHVLLTDYTTKESTKYSFIFPVDSNKQH